MTCLITAIVVLAACGGGELGELHPAESPVSQSEVDSNGSAEGLAVTYPPPNLPKREAGGLTDWAVHQANSLEDLAAAYDTIVVARATSVEVGYPWAPFIAQYFGSANREGGETPPPEHPKAGLPTPNISDNLGPLISTYQFEILQILRSEKLQVGDVIPISQWGGVVDGVLEEAREDPVMKLDATYLLYLRLQGDGNYSGPPFARFEVSADGRVISVNHEAWGQLAAVAELSGKSLADASNEIETALAASSSTAE